MIEGEKRGETSGFLLRLGKVGRIKEGRRAERLLTRVAWRAALMRGKQHPVKRSKPISFHMGDGGDKGR